MIATIVQLALAFGAISLLAFGGGTAVLPQMKDMTVVQHAWLTAQQFNDIYSIGQFAPGPNMLIIAVIGYRVASFPGALAATLAFFLPACLLMFFVGRLWHRIGATPWRASVQHALGPISIGLMLSGVFAVGKTADATWIGLLMSVVAAGLLMRTAINPLLVITCGGAAGWLFFR